MNDLTNRFHYKSLELALYKLSAIFRREYLDSLVHETMDKVFTDSYQQNVKPVEHEADTSDEEAPTEHVKKPRGRPRKNT